MSTALINLNNARAKIHATLIAGDYVAARDLEPFIRFRRIGSVRSFLQFVFAFRKRGDVQIPPEQVARARRMLDRAYTAVVEEKMPMKPMKNFDDLARRQRQRYFAQARVLEDKEGRAAAVRRVLWSEGFLMLITRGIIDGTFEIALRKVTPRQFEAWIAAMERQGVPGTQQAAMDWLRKKRGAVLRNAGMADPTKSPRNVKGFIRAAKWALKSNKTRALLALRSMRLSLISVKPYLRWHDVNIVVALAPPKAERDVNNMARTAIMYRKLGDFGAADIEVPSKEVPRLLGLLKNIERRVTAPTVYRALLSKISE